MGTLSKISLSGVVFRISITSLLVQPKKQQVQKHYRKGSWVKLHFALREEMEVKT